MAAVLAVDQHRAAGLVPLDAGDDLDEGRLARSVLTGEAMNLAGDDIEINVGQRANTAEALRNISKLKKV